MGLTYWKDLMTRDPSSIHDWFAKGSQARADGLTIIDNPLYAKSALPAVTGETLQEWQTKVDAWEAGFNQAKAA